MRPAALLKIVSSSLQRVRSARTERTLRVTTTPTFASLWLIPRLADFQQRYPHIHVHVVAENALRNLRRDDYDLAIRYSPKAAAEQGATKLFGESLLPLCSPNLVVGKPLRRPEELRHFFLIHFNDLEGNAPWLTWETWFTGVGAGIVEGKGALHFSHYDQAVRAALAGQGVVLGRLPVVDDLLQDGRLIAPFGLKLAVTLEDKSYWLMLAEHRREKREVRAFVAWLLENAKATDSRGSQSKRGVSCP